MMRTLFFAAALATAGVASAQGLEPGEWEFNSTMTSAMLPKPQNMVFRHCIKKEDADNPERWMGQKQRETDCKFTPLKKSGDGYSWEMNCPKSNMKGSGTVRMGQGTMQSEMRMSGDAKGQKFEMHTKMSGKRLGACKS
jgi:hypothetical protein